VPQPTTLLRAPVEEMWNEIFVISLRDFYGVSLDGLQKPMKNPVSLAEIRTEHLSNMSLDPYRNANLLFFFFSTPSCRMNTEFPFYPLQQFPD
jgi:hypothetical protein